MIVFIKISTKLMVNYESEESFIKIPNMIKVTCIFQNVLFILPLQFQQHVETVLKHLPDVVTLIFWQLYLEMKQLILHFREFETCWLPFQLGLQLHVSLPVLYKSVRTDPKLSQHKIICIKVKKLYYDNTYINHYIKYCTDKNLFIVFFVSFLLYFEAEKGFIIEYDVNFKYD